MNCLIKLFVQLLHFPRSDTYIRANNSSLYLYLSIPLARILRSRKYSRHITLCNSILFASQGILIRKVVKTGLLLTGTVSWETMCPRRAPSQPTPKTSPGRKHPLRIISNVHLIIFCQVYSRNCKPRPGITYLDHSNPSFPVKKPQVYQVDQITYNNQITRSGLPYSGEESRSIP